MDGICPIGESFKQIFEFLSVRLFTIVNYWDKCDVNVWIILWRVGSFHSQIKLELCFIHTICYWYEECVVDDIRNVFTERPSFEFVFTKRSKEYCTQRCCVDSDGDFNSIAAEFNFFLKIESCNVGNFGRRSWQPLATVEIEFEYLLTFSCLHETYPNDKDRVDTNGKPQKSSTLHISL